MKIITVIGISIIVASVSLLTGQLYANIGKLMNASREVQAISKPPVQLDYTFHKINCNTERNEGDMTETLTINNFGRITNRSYRLSDPTGDWRIIQPKDIRFQLEHGGRMVECVPSIKFE